MVELIPGTTLPIYAPGASEQREGRGTVEITPERMPRSLLEKIEDPSGLTPAERAFIGAALRAYDRRPRFIRSIFAVTSARSDASTGNLVVPLLEVPAGCEGHLTYVLIDAPGSATINPSAPFSNASAWAFVAAAGTSSGPGNTGADALRPGMVAFAPTSAAGPFIPGQWTFNDTNAPVGQGGDQFYFVMHGGSVAGLLGLTLQVTYRVNLFGFET